MANLTITIAGDKAVARKLTGLARATPGSLRRGLTLFGNLLVRDMKKKVSGPGRVRQAWARTGTRGEILGYRQRKGSTAKHSRVFSGMSPYPGVVTGSLRRSINKRIFNSAGQIALRVGPNVRYAVYLERKPRGHGGYPFVGPTLRDNIDKGMDLIQAEIMKGWR